MRSTVFAEGVSVEDVLEGVHGIEKSVEEGVGGEETQELVVASALVGEVDGGVEDEGELCEIEDDALEGPQENTLIHDLGEGVTESSRLAETCLEGGVGLEGSDESIEGWVSAYVRLRRRRGRLSPTKEAKLGYLTLLKASSYLRGWGGTWPRRTCDGRD